jgi:hypothetical protein
MVQLGEYAKDFAFLRLLFFKVFELKYDSVNVYLTAYVKKIFSIS